MNYDVFFYEAFDEEETALRRCLPAGARAGFTWKTIQEHGSSAPEADLISIRTQSAIPTAWANQLRAILSRSTGYDHLCAYRRLAARPLECGYLPLYCHRAVAEQAMLLWMALLRKLPRQTVQFKNFCRDGLTGGEAQGRSLLVVGVGNIGHEAIKIGRGLDMRARGVDICRKHPDVDYGDIVDLMPEADVIVCAMNLTAQNRGYFDAPLLGAARQGAIFVNVSRGELSPPGALLEALESGRLGGVGLDVYSEESVMAVALREGGVPDNSDMRAVLRMAGRDNVILTPHNAFNTHEAVARKAEQSMRQVAAWLSDGAFLWPVPPDK